MQKLFLRPKQWIIPIINWKPQREGKFRNHGLSPRLLSTKINWSNLTDEECTELKLIAAFLSHKNYEICDYIQKRRNF